MDDPIDRSSFWGELNIQKGELRVKGFLSQHLEVVWGLFQQGFGGILERWGALATFFFNASSLTAGINNDTIPMCLR
jgi:hypothetical protein